MLPSGTEVFIASLPKDTSDQQALAAVKMQRAGLTPVPHLVARNMTGMAEFESIVGRLVAEAGVDRALLLAGDRDSPAGDLQASLQLIESGVLQKHGIRRVFISAYPEGHPRIDPETLTAARAQKLAAADKAGFEVTLVSQFCFDAKPIIALAEQLRAEQVRAPFRVGVAGPAGRATLLKYALMCGVGPSIRALKSRQSMAKNMLAAESPEEVLADVGRAIAADGSLGIRGRSFFYFCFPDLDGSMGSTAAYGRMRTNRRRGRRERRLTPDARARTGGGASAVNTPQQRDQRLQFL